MSVKSRMTRLTPAPSTPAIFMSHSERAPIIRCVEVWLTVHQPEEMRIHAMKITTGDVVPSRPRKAPTWVRSAAASPGASPSAVVPRLSS